MSRTSKYKKGIYLKKRKMLPFAYTDDGHSPIKLNGGSSGESSPDIPFNKNKNIRKQNQRANKVENKRARQYLKLQLKKELDKEIFIK